VDRTDCCVVAPSRGIAPGVAGRVLSAAWHELAESAGPACVLRLHSGAPVVAWVNRALCELLAVDAGELAGRPLRDLVDAQRDGTSDGPRDGSRDGSRHGSWDGSRDGSWDGSRGSASDDVPAAAGAFPVPGQPAGPAGPAERSPLDWATAVHRLSRGVGGTAAAVLARADGTVRPVQVRVTPVTPPDGARPGPPDTFGASVAPPGVVDPLPAPAGITCWLVTLDPASDTMTDLQAAAATAEHRFAALARCAPVGIFASDVGLRLGFVNDRFAALTGLPTHALLGTGWLDAVHRDDLPGLYQAVQTVLGGAPVELTTRLVRDEDRQCWLQLRLAPTTTPERAAGFIGTAEDVTERRSWEEHLTYQAQHDPLTGLVNRRRLIEVLTDVLSSRRGRDREFAVLFLDLDGFKEINDTYGHDAGDRALIEVARRLQKVVRDTDLLARVAGDEFVVVLRQVTSEAEAAAAARRHLAALASPVRIGRTEVALSASVGVAMPTGFDTPESLLRAADRVMYEAKAAGHGLYRLAPVAGEGR